MFRYILYPLLSLLFVYFFIPINRVDNQLIKYDVEYKKYLREYCPKAKFIRPIQKIMYMDWLDENILAYCQTNHFSHMAIVVNLRYWYNLGEEQKFHVMFHELTHCYIGYDHIMDPKHFMHPSENFFKKETVISQLKDLLLDHCK